MNNSTRSTVEKFTVYSQLGWFGRWKFCRALTCISQDTVSLELLLEFEKKLKKRPLLSDQIAGIIIHALSWYNREDHDNRITGRIRHERLPEMLCVIIAFLNKDHGLHRSYRELILHIIYTSDNFNRSHEVSFGITPEAFQIEAAEVISNISQIWKQWRPLVNDEANRTLGYLKNIANKVSDSGQFSVVCRNMAPVIGLKATSSLIAISRDFQEFENCYLRITAQLQWWGFDYYEMFSQFQDISDPNQLLHFLETLIQDPRMARCIQYTQTNHSGFLLMPKGEVKSTCLEREWKNASDCGLLIDSLIGKFEENIVCADLRIVWYSFCASVDSNGMRWEFSKFTEYIPYVERNQDWAVDNEHNRRYWDWSSAESLEYWRFINTLKPKLCLLFNTLTLSEIKTLFTLLPDYFSVQEFTKTVHIPVTWNRSTIWQEGYNKWDGFYNEEIEVARPEEFRIHTFTFERPYLQKAINLLDHVDKIHEILQAHKNLRNHDDSQ